MSEKTKIAWADSTANFWEGCTKVSAGCANCYAEARDKRFTGGKLWGVGKARRKSKSAVKDCLAWNKKPWICDCCGAASAASKDGNDPFCSECNSIEPSFHRRKMFSLSLGDWLDPEVPIAWLAEMLDTILKCDQLIFILCTKRPELWSERLHQILRHTSGSIEFEGWLSGWLDGVEVPKNIWLLTSVENQKAADERIPQLLKIPAAVRGLSMEPLLEEVELKNLKQVKQICTGANCSPDYSQKDCEICNGTGWMYSGCEIQWLILGGESGMNARPCSVEWIRSLVQQGAAAGVPVFMKQLGSNSVPRHWNADGSKGVQDKKGGNPEEWPTDLRGQEFPV